MGNFIEAVREAERWRSRDGEAKVEASKRGEAIERDENEAILVSLTPALVGGQRWDGDVLEDVIPHAVFHLIPRFGCLLFWCGLVAWVATPLDRNRELSSMPALSKSLLLVSPSFNSLLDPTLTSVYPDS